MFTFIVFLASILLLVLQLAGAELTPRIISVVFRDRVTRFALTLFAFTFTFTLALLLRIHTSVPAITAYVSGYLCLFSIGVFLYLIDHVGKLLRPSGALRAVSRMGHEVIQSVYPRTLSGPQHAAQNPVQPGAFYLTSAKKLDTNVLTIAMPANLQQLHEAFGRIGGYLRSTARDPRQAQSPALELVKQVAADPDRLRARIAKTVAEDASLRCAVPGDENLAVGFDCPGGARVSTLLAVDGSKAIADRHEEVAFALINIGSVCIEQGTGRVPQVAVEIPPLDYAVMGKLVPRKCNLSVLQSYVRKSEVEYWRKRAAVWQEFVKAMASWVKVNREIEEELRQIGRLRCEPLPGGDIRE